jgi:hypothetical protein
MYTIEVLRRLIEGATEGVGRTRVNGGCGVSLINPANRTFWKGSTTFICNRVNSLKSVGVSKLKQLKNISVFTI